ncbi:MAG: hypothetical protein KJ737_11795 [Proteobacteria bacterium]|nr:hypothetical protein [Pseudomonadota bacterium]
MRKNILKGLYNSSPESVKRVYAFIPYSYRMGRKYREMIKFLEKSQTFSKEELDAYQLSKLKHLLCYAEKKVPYYKNLFKSVAFDPEKFSSFDRLAEVPLLSKKAVFDSYEQLKSTDYTFLNSYEGLTGGTTGQPLKLLLSVESHAYEEAFLHTIWKRVGYKPSLKRVSLMGAPFRESHNEKKIVKYDYFNNQLQLSPQDLDEHSVEEYIQKLEAFKPQFFHGFASAITVLAKHLKDSGKTINGIKGTLCGSENIFPSQKVFLEDFFHAPLLAWYGQTEKVVMGGACEKTSEYHMFSEYGYLELVDENGNVINEPGKTGEIVGTGFINMAMPLIRYKTGDLGEYADGDCLCGRKYPRIRKIKGRRNQDFLIGNKNEQVPLTSLDMQGLSFEKVYQLQFEQKEAGKVDLNIVSDKSINDHDIKIIRDELESQVGKRIKFSIDVVAHLKKSETGKVRPCIQHLDGSPL